MTAEGPSEESGAGSGQAKDKRDQGTRRPQQGRHSFQQPATPKQKFEGKSEELKGHIYAVCWKIEVARL